MAQEAERILSIDQRTAAEAILNLAHRAERQGEVDAARALEALADRVGQRSFQLAVAGQFKRGKSTLINALLGIPLLPTDVLPLTSAPTYIVPNTDPGVVVTFRDGRSLATSTDELRAYATEEGNPGNVRGVLRVTVGTTAPGLTEGLRLIDLPGVGSTVEANSLVAYEAVTEADAAIFVIGADPPLTQEEIGFLGQLAGQVPRVFIVQNKRDLFDERDWVKAMRFNQDTVQRVIGPTDIYSVSAKDALRAQREASAERLERSGWPTLLDALREFFARERNHVFWTSVYVKMGETTSPILQALRIQERSLSLPLTDLEGRLALLRGRQQDVEESGDRLLLLFRHKFGLQQRELDRRLAVWVREVEPVLRARLASDAAPMSRDQWDARVVQAVWEAAVQQLAQEEEAWQTWWESLAVSLTQEGNQAVRGLEETYQHVLGVAWESWSEVRPPQITMQFQLTDLDRASFFPEVSLSLLAAWMPPLLARQVLMSRVDRRLPDLIDQYRGRIRHTVTSAVEHAGHDLVGRIRSIMSEVASRLNLALEDAYRLKSETEQGLPAATRLLDQQIRGWQADLETFRRAVETTRGPSPDSER